MTAESFDSVWDAIAETHEEAESLKAKSALMRELQAAIGRWGLTQKSAAERLGVSQPRLNDLLRGRIQKFSLDTLVDLAMRADLRVEISVSPRAA